MVLWLIYVTTKMAPDFCDKTFTFKIDPAFNFEANVKVQINASEKEILTKISTTPANMT